MDFIPLIDSIGENATALVGGIVIGGLFGFFAQRSAFCTRSAVLDLTRRRDYAALATWAAGFAAAVLGVQLLLNYGYLDVRDTRFFSTAQSLSGALIGGTLFGVGMVLARGCVSRMLILAASGNLRALYVTLVIAIVGYATYAGVLVPLRDAAGGLWSTAAIGGNDLLAHAGLGPSAGLVVGAVLALAALAVAFAVRASAWRVLGGIGVGASVVAGWYFTYTLSLQVFEPIQAESLSYIRPLATTSALAISPDAFAGLDQGVLIGTLVAAFLAAVAFREFRVVTFSEPGTPSILRYTAGAALMGFGGILAVGCTIGAGLTGGSVLAVSSLVGLGSMIAGAAVADRFVDRQAVAVPAHDAVAVS
ncbi:YeeE/YedE thiosulfate transporter family protein [Aurantimonas endophytica]|uniref:Putative membrane protein YedE/YeeE n=1 Tax=Aurantimonas endophytica TaxID=1522175 RepID=A0A7W6MQH7_9HYPH|nr:YeeE/YedE thiosulfate transporter family protein [Aurantimonas endophytica]MBB4004080.1 putative membrane protein YedE/YeeE [Aurantimonas endophytica]MCO6404926.1 YeeE/YedE family protein [Aurantimonas endophytica]